MRREVFIQTFPVETLRKLLNYDPQSGTFTWLSGHRKGREAGYVRHDGRRSIMVSKVPIEAHRLAWFYTTGQWPQIIDHIDVNPLNNSFRNLREALPWQNNANTRYRGSLLKGVTFHKKTGKYQAQIKKGGKSYYLGLFSSVGEANAAYAGAAKILFGEFARAA